jgi:hypothetical protein
MYITQDKDGKLTGTFARPQFEGHGPVKEDDPLLIAFQAEQQKATDNQNVKVKLIEIDIASIRSIREYICKLPDAPEYLKQHEAEAVTERTKIK